MFSKPKSNEAVPQPTETPPAPAAFASTPAESRPPLPAPPARPKLAQRLPLAQQFVAAAGI